MSRNFVESKHEPCIFYKVNKQNIVIIAVYVDDYLIFYNNENEFTETKNALQSKFKIKDLGPVAHILGMKVERDNAKKTIKISNKQYILEILDRFGMQDANPVSTPLETNIKLEKATGNNSYNEYQELIGCLMYLSVTCRPDIAYATSYLSQFNNCNNETHWVAAKRVLRYLKGTLDLGIVYGRTEEPLQSYVDADWGNDPNDRKSYSGFVLKLNGAAIAWESKKQRIVSLSSTEAEYISLSEGSRQTIYICNLVQKLMKNFRYINLIMSSDIPNIFCDSQSAISIATNPFTSKRSKHIHIIFHSRFCRKEDN